MSRVSLGDVGGLDDVPQDRLHDEMARRRVYLHPNRWTSLGLSLLEAMHLGMPVVALATTEVPEAVPPAAGVVSNRVDVLADGLRAFVADPGAAQAAGQVARRTALERYGLGRFRRVTPVRADATLARADLAYRDERVGLVAASTIRGVVRRGQRPRGITVRSRLRPTASSSSAPGR